MHGPPLLLGEGEAREHAEGPEGRIILVVPLHSITAPHCTLSGPPLFQQLNRSTDSPIKPCNMPMPDADIFPHATGKAEATVKAHSQGAKGDGLTLYAGW